MDNTSIHKHPIILPIEKVRGYKCIFVPPYSPELDAIQQFWYAVKSRLMKERLLSKETLSSSK